MNTNDSVAEKGATLKGALVGFAMGLPWPLIDWAMSEEAFWLVVLLPPALAFLGGMFGPLYVKARSSGLYGNSAIKGASIGLAMGMAILGMKIVAGTSHEPWDWLLILWNTAFLTMLGWFIGPMVAESKANESKIQVPWRKPFIMGAALGSAAFLYALFLEGGLDLGDVWLLLIVVVFAALQAGLLFVFVHVWILNPPSRRRKTFKILGWSLGAIVSLYLVLLIINLHDEDLLPEARKIMETRGFTVKPEENAFFAIAGFEAPQGQDPHAFGRKRVAFWESEERKPYRERRFDERPLYGGDPRSPKVPIEKLNKLCDWDKAVCLEPMAQSRDIIAGYLAENVEWIERYQSLLRLPRFEEHQLASAQSPIPSYHSPLHISRLRKAHCAVLVQDGKVGECLNLLDQDIGFARRMLSGARTLIGKMVAANALRRDYSVLSEIVTARPDAARQAAPLLEKLLTPLTPDEMDMTKPFQGELNWWSNEISDLRSEATLMQIYTGSMLEPETWEKALNSLVKPFVQVNASINHQYRWFTLMSELSKLPASQSQAKAAAYDSKRKDLEPDMSFPAILYNPIGKILQAIAIPAFDDFSLRLHDLDGQQRLLRLQWRIVKEQVPLDKVAEFVQAAGAQFHDPYTGQPMTWDAQGRTLSFRGMSKYREINYLAKY